MLVLTSCPLEFTPLPDKSEGSVVLKLDEVLNQYFLCAHAALGTQSDKKKEK